MYYSNIKEFHTYLSKSCKYLNFEEYLDVLIYSFYDHLDIHFLKYLLSIWQKENEFCVESNKLYKYKMVNYYDIKNYFKELGLIENKDYIVDNSIELRNITKQTYKLTPSAFKTCLIYSGYSRYFNDIETFLQYYKDYQNKIMINLYHKNEDFYNKFNQYKELCYI
jgi:hypothetical protein